MTNVRAFMILSHILLIGGLLTATGDAQAMTPPCDEFTSTETTSSAFDRAWLCRALAGSGMDVTVQIDRDDDVEVLLAGSYVWLRPLPAEDVVVYFTFADFQDHATDAQREQLVQRLNENESGLVYEISQDGRLMILLPAPSRMLADRADVARLYMYFVYNLTQEVPARDVERILV